ncbi:MAG TPA: zf-HC2 domain-containing protein [Bryobacteraceae bacterium]|nr:zf-HC2 domain-containing protein [Bryobacteraceae bacterium]
MNCPLGTRDHAELLVAYSSHKLDAAKTAAVDEHIGGCAACREFVRGQQAVWDALDMWEPEPISADFNRRLYQRIDAQVTWWDRLLLPLRPLAFHRTVPLAAAACFVLAIGFVLDQTAAPPEQQPAHVNAVADVEGGLQPDQVLKALDEMEALSRFNRLMKSDAPEAKM